MDTVQSLSALVIVLGTGFLIYLFWGLKLIKQLGDTQIAELNANYKLALCKDSVKILEEYLEKNPDLTSEDINYLQKNTLNYIKDKIGEVKYFDDVKSD